MSEQQKFKDVTRDKLIDIFHKIFILEYQVSNSSLEDDSEIAMLESNYEGVYDAWIVAVFDGMGIDYWDYDDADSKFEHLDNQIKIISELIKNIEEDSLIKNSISDSLLNSGIGNDASVYFFKKNLAYLLERFEGWG